LFTYELARRLKGRGITVNALHPGVISTKLLHAGFGMGGASLGEGAETPVYLSVSPDVAAVTGKYFIRRQQTNSSALSNDAELQERFWKESIRLAGIEEENFFV
jgi:NAD(P)-dependent dehydrogenase (short-subunit alcohol dehydrogenase family)